MIAEDLVFRETFFFGRTDLYRDEQLLDLLEQAHLNRVLVGIESLNQQALDQVEKHQRWLISRPAARLWHGTRSG